MASGQRADFKMNIIPSYAVESDAPVEFFLSDEAPTRGGGQGVVLSVRDASGMRFALKAFSDRRAAEREWEALQFHKNDRIVPEPFFFGRLARMPEELRPRPWAIVMEFIDGVTLGSLLEANRRKGARFTWERTMEIMAPVVHFCARNSERTSRRPTAHRDIKPDNIVIENGTNKTRVVDFGIAARRRRGKGGLRGVPRGTEGFSAPEVFLPDGVDVPPGDDDSPKVDTYSIAAVMLTMLGGYPGPPEYGSRFDHGMTIEHDQSAMEEIAARLTGSLSAIYGIDLCNDVAVATVRSGAAVVDVRVKACLSRCLSLEQGKRPDPSELPSVIPLDMESLSNEVHLISSVTSLGGGERFKSSVAIDSEIRADRSVLEALDEFNSGHYERAAEIFEKRSRKGWEARGAVSCTYYLGVMIRDGCFSASKNYSMGDVAFLFGQAAEAGNVLAQNALGQMLYEGFVGEDGETVVVDRELGLEWVRRSAEDRPEEGKTGFRFAKEFLAQRAEDVE